MMSYTDTTYYNDASWNNNFGNGGTNDSYLSKNYNYDNTFYDSDESNWNLDWDSLFTLEGQGEDSSDFWESIKNYVNSKEGAQTIIGTVGGVGSGLLEYMQQQQQEDQFNTATEAQQAYWDRQLDIAEAQVRAQNRAIELQERVQRDKENTRKRHNDSINSGSSTGVKTVKFK